MGKLPKAKMVQNGTYHQHTIIAGGGVPTRPPSSYNRCQAHERKYSFFFLIFQIMKCNFVNPLL